MDGILIIDKEKNMTSRDVVNILNKTLQTKKIGHTGTLDPLATGVLVICIGKALKLVEEFQNHDKEYIATMKFGFLTDTLDNTGNILKKDKKKITKEQLEKALMHFTTTYDQQVPAYSAVKINGKKLYEYARNGIDISLPTRTVTISSLKLLKFKDNTATISCLVSKGTYIRSLIRDIAAYLDTYATMIDLRRTRVGDFKITDSYKLEDLKNKNYKLIKIKECLKDYLFVKITDNLRKKIYNGNVVENIYTSNKVAFVDDEDNVIALYNFDPQNNYYKINKMLK